MGQEKVEAEQEDDADTKFVEPDTIITSAPPAFTNSTNAVLSFEGQGATSYTYECKLRYESWKPCSATVTYSNLPEGDSLFSVRAIAGKVKDSTPAEVNWTIDITPPAVSNLVASKPALTNSPAITFTFKASDVNAIFFCSVDKSPWEICESGITYAPVGEGKHTFDVTAADAVFNWQPTPAHYEWEVDLTPPIASLAEGFSEAITLPTGTISFVCTEPSCSYQCNFDLSTWTSCLSSFTKKFSGGSHSLMYKAMDPAGNEQLIPGLASWETMEWLLVRRAPPYGSDEYCGIKRDFKTYCGRYQSWYGMEYQPLAIPPMQDIALGSQHRCGLGVTGQVYCWGRDTYGQLGTNTTAVCDGHPCSASPLALEGFAATSIATGGYHTCAIREGALYCWGANTAGQLGLGDTTHRSLPTQVGTDSLWTKVVAAGELTCALKSDKTLWCWGPNSTNLGCGYSCSSKIPRALSGGNWVDVTVSETDACAIKADGSLWCWGENQYGQIGDGTRTTRTTPTQESSLSSWSSVARGGSATCGIKTNGTLWCWGAAYLLGNGTVVGPDQCGDGFCSFAPMQVDENSWQEVATAGSNRMCAIKADTSLWCWGSSIYSPMQVPLR